MHILSSFFSLLPGFKLNEAHDSKQVCSQEHSDSLYAKTEYYVRQSRELRAALAKSIETMHHTNNNATLAFNTLAIEAKYEVLSSHCQASGRFS